MVENKWDAEVGYVSAMISTVDCIIFTEGKSTVSSKSALLFKAFVRERIQLTDHQTSLSMFHLQLQFRRAYP